MIQEQLLQLLYVERTARELIEFVADKHQIKNVYQFTCPKMQNLARALEMAGHVLNFPSDKSKMP